MKSVPSGMQGTYTGIRFVTVILETAMDDKEPSRVAGN
jgi:hypothetical protein